MTSTAVATPADLARAIKVAQPGDVIELASGPYGVVVVNGVKVAAPGVTIQPAAGASPVLTGLTIQGLSSGINAEGLQIQMAPAQTYGVSIVSSGQANLDRLTVQQADGSLAGVGVFVRNAQDVVLTSSEMHHLGVGLSVMDCANITVRGNSIHDVRVDGMDIAGSSGVTVDANHITDLHPQPGEHPDAIQFWATPTHPLPSGNVVTGNVYVRGSGGAGQGVFVESQADITISGNALLGCMANGISLSTTKGAKITGNFVVGYSDSGSRVIVRGMSSDVLIDGNLLSENIQNLHTVGMADTVNFMQGTNTIIAAVPPGDLSALVRWQATGANASATAVQIHDLTDQLATANAKLAAVRTAVA